MDFGQALSFLRAGMRLTREGWNGKDMFIELQRPDEGSKMTLPYIYLTTPGKGGDRSYKGSNRVPWLASQTDLLSYDWKMV